MALLPDQRRGLAVPAGPADPAGDRAGRRRRVGDPRLKIVIWHDRFVWLDARVASKRDGWIWEWTFDGRLLGDKSGKDLVEAVEKTIHILSYAKQGETDQLSAPWKPLLARGPKAVV